MQPYAYAYNNPIFYTDPTGMEGEGWIETEIDGKRSIFYDSTVNSKQEAIDKHYVGVTNYYDAATVTSINANGEQIDQYKLDSAGIATDSNGNVMFANFTNAGGMSIGVNRDTQTIVSIRAMPSIGFGGMGGEVRFSCIIGYGWSGALGYVSADGKNGSSFYANINFGVGYDVGPSFSLFSVNRPAGHDFKIGDFAGRGMSYSGTAFFLNSSYGGTDQNQKFGIKDMVPSNFGTGPTGYTTTSLGINPFGFGGSYQYGGTQLFWTTPPAKK